MAKHEMHILVRVDMHKATLARIRDRALSGSFIHASLTYTLMLDGREVHRQIGELLTPFWSASRTTPAYNAPTAALLQRVCATAIWAQQLYPGGAAGAAVVQYGLSDEDLDALYHGVLNIIQTAKDFEERRPRLEHWHDTAEAWKREVPDIRIVLTEAAAEGLQLLEAAYEESKGQPELTIDV